jgi:hypothetical protein
LKLNLETKSDQNNQLQNTISAKTEKVFMLDHAYGYMFQHAFVFSSRFNQYHYAKKYSFVILETILFQIFSLFSFNLQYIEVNGKSCKKFQIQNI